MVREVLKGTSNDPNALRLFGLLHIRSGDHKAGIRWLERAASAAPRSFDIARDLARAWQSYGDALFHAGRDEEARDAQRRSIASDPHFDAMRRAAEASARGRGREAESVYRKILGANPDHVHALVGLANIAIDRNAPDDADRLLARAMAVSPNMSHVHRARARLAMSRVAVRSGRGGGAAGDGHQPGTGGVLDDARHGAVLGFEAGRGGGVVRPGARDRPQGIARQTLARPRPQSARRRPGEHRSLSWRSTHEPRARRGVVELGRPQDLRVRRRRSPGDGADARPNGVEPARPRGPALRPRQGARGSRHRRDGLRPLPARQRASPAAGGLQGGPVRRTVRQAAPRLRVDDARCNHGVRSSADFRRRIAALRFDPCGSDPVVAQPGAGHDGTAAHPGLRPRTRTRHRRLSRLHRAHGPERPRRAWRTLP